MEYCCKWHNICAVQEPRAIGSLVRLGGMPLLHLDARGLEVSRSAGA
eukprot:CAMPEP_0204518664 /NCGR_PEP_ID=MMETSP0661-20131031/4319_1 /ASSEMBLY_ACC=CAM_ASM_000606 /TAXON_ID=109239 /ORGANISM="Alexandrium margalefi, Strain AMGDE01CS-322" /LENGTH=46 /DNA_ID= /DNA_START= /DNA_END= /DNA_ORIENTATION=